MCENCWCRPPGGCSVLCTSCCLVSYCGDHCKVLGMEEHRLECNTMSQLGTARLGLNDQLRLLVRIWLKIRREGVEKVEEEGALSKCWDNLVDHTQELLEASRDVLIAQYNELGAVLKKADMPSMDTFVNIYGKILVNAFSLRSDRLPTTHIKTFLILLFQHFHSRTLWHRCLPEGEPPEPLLHPQLHGGVRGQAARSCCHQEDPGGGDS